MKYKTKYLIVCMIFLAIALTAAVSYIYLNEKIKDVFERSIEIKEEGVVFSPPNPEIAASRSFFKWYFDDIGGKSIFGTGPKLALPFADAHFNSEHTSSAIVFQTYKDFELFLSSHAETALPGLPSDIASKAIYNVIEWEDFSPRQRKYKSYSEEVRKAAVGHYYNVMGMLYRGMLGALEGMAASDVFLGRPVLDGIVIRDDNPFKAVLDNKINRLRTSEKPVIDRPRISHDTYDLLKTTIQPLEKRIECWEASVRFIDSLPGQPPYPAPLLTSDSVKNLLQTELCLSLTELDFQTFFNPDNLQEDPRYSVNQDVLIKIHGIRLQNKLNEEKGFLIGIQSGLIPWSMGDEFKSRFLPPYSGLMNDLSVDEAIAMQLEASYEKTKVFLDKAQQVSMYMTTLEENVYAGLFASGEGQYVDELKYVLENSAPVFGFSFQENNPMGYPAATPYDPERIHKYFANNFLRLSNEWFMYEDKINQAFWEDINSPRSQLMMTGAMLLAGAAAGPFSYIMPYLRAARNTQLEMGAGYGLLAVPGLILTSLPATRTVLGLTVIGVNLGFSVHSISVAVDECNKVFFKDPGFDKPFGDPAMLLALANFGPYQIRDYKACVIGIGLAAAQLSMNLLPELSQNFLTAEYQIIDGIAYPGRQLAASEMRNIIQLHTPPAGAFSWRVSMVTVDQQSGKYSAIAMLSDEFRKYVTHTNKFVKDNYARGFINSRAKNPAIPAADFVAGNEQAAGLYAVANEISLWVVQNEKIITMGYVGKVYPNNDIVIPFSVLEKTSGKGVSTNIASTVRIVTDTPLTNAYELAYGGKTAALTRLASTPEGTGIKNFDIMLLGMFEEMQKLFPDSQLLLDVRGGHMKYYMNHFKKLDQEFMANAPIELTGKYPKPLPEYTSTVNFNGWDTSIPGDWKVLPTLTQKDNALGLPIVKQESLIFEGGAYAPNLEYYLLGLDVDAVQKLRIILKWKYPNTKLHDFTLE